MPNVRPYQPFPTLAEFLRATLHDTYLFDARAQQFRAVKGAVDSDRARQAVEQATRWAAVDTGAIEGLYEVVDRGITFSVAATAQAIESADVHIGTTAKMHITDALAGYELMLDLATQKSEINEYRIKELHAAICASQVTYTVYVGDGQTQQRTLVGGDYKTETNYPLNIETDTLHSYAAPGDETSAEMARLVEELSSPVFHQTHPALQAAYVHYAFVVIHPFPDGNGRVARALASTYLYRDPGVPLVVFADQKNGYIAALEAADEGNREPFVTFMIDRAADTLAMLITLLALPQRQEAKSAAALLRSNLITRDGVTHAEVDALAAKLATVWLQAIVGAVSRAGDIAPISVATDRANGSLPPAFRQVYRLAPAAETLSVIATAPAPTAAKVAAQYQIRIPRAGSDIEAAFVLALTGVEEPLLSINLRDVNPEVSGALRFQFDAVADAEVDRIVAAAVNAGIQAMRDAGY